MKSLFSILMITLFSIPVLAQGLQDGGQGSGGDEKAEYTVAVTSGWNIISVPITVSDYSKINLFPTAASSAYAFQSGYVVRDTLVNGIGYWLKFTTPQGLSLSGAIIYTDTLPVHAGWNMVGSISDPIAPASITPLGTTIQSTFFYFSNGYQVATTIDPGKGYWVKTSSAGSLVLSSGSFLARGTVPDLIARTLPSFNSITVTDASGNQQKLFFGADTTIAQEFFDLPPAGPAGTFDARFASQKMVAVRNENISLSSATYPVQLQWNITSPGEFALVVDGKETPLRTSGSMVLTSPSSRMALRIGSSPELPKEFGLSQNYPNPFNPTTSIRFALPVQSKVNIELYSILGQRVATIVSDDLPAGYHAATWSGSGNNNQALGSGVYFYRISAVPVSGGNVFVDVKKMVLMK